MQLFQGTPSHLFLINECDSWLWDVIRINIKMIQFQCHHLVFFLTAVFFSRIIPNKITKSQTNKRWHSNTNANTTIMFSRHSFPSTIESRYSPKVTRILLFPTNFDFTNFVETSDFQNFPSWFTNIACILFQKDNLVVSESLSV